MFCLVDYLVIEQVILPKRIVISFFELLVLMSKLLILLHCK